jgi:hypothetical protein
MKSLYKTSFFVAVGANSPPIWGEPVPIFREAGGEVKEWFKKNIVKIIDAKII